MQLSPCFGTYSDDEPTCNGQPGADGLDGQPCSSRVQCYALTGLCVGADIDRAVHLGYQMMSDDEKVVRAAVPHRQGEFDALVEAYVLEHSVGVEDGLVRSGATVKPPVFGNRRPVAAGPFPTPWLRSRVVGDMFTAWREALVRYLSQYPLHVGPRAIMPGNIVEGDGLRLDGRVTYWLQLARGKRRALARLELGGRTGLLDIELPLTTQEFTGLGSAGIDCRRTEGRRFKSVVTDVDLQGMPAVCELLAVAVNRGLINTELNLPGRTAQ